MVFLSFLKHLRIIKRTEKKDPFQRRTSTGSIRVEESGSRIKVPFFNLNTKGFQLQPLSYKMMILLGFD